MERIGPFDPATGAPTYGNDAANTLSNGNVSTGEAGDIIAVEMVTHPISEIVNVIENALGADAPDHTDLTQLHQSINAMIVAAQPDLAPIIQAQIQAVSINTDQELRIRASEGRYNGGIQL